MPPAATAEQPKTDAQLTAEAAGKVDALMAAEREGGDEAETGAADPAAPEGGEGGSDAAKGGAEGGEGAAASAGESEQIVQLREGLAEIRGMLSGQRATTTDAPGGAAAPQGGSGAKASRLDKIQQAIGTIEKKLDDGKGDWGQPAEALGIKELLGALGNLREELAELRNTQDGLTKDHQSRAQGEQQQAIDAVHAVINDAAASSPELTVALGGAAISRYTAAQRHARQAVYNKATRLYADSIEDARLGIGKALTEEQALHAAIKTVTGKDVPTGEQPAGTVKLSAAEQAAKDRARTVKRESAGGSGGKDAKQTPEDATKQAVEAANRFLKGQ